MTIVIAHRGASGQAPENTIEAFRLAVEAGADAIELDIHLTADDHLAVIHDESLDRTTDATGLVAELSMATIRAADAGARFTRPDDADPPFDGKGLTVPTLSEVLDWLPDETGLVIEIKTRAAVDRVMEALAMRGAPAGALRAVISFDEVAIERVRELDPRVRTGYLLVPGQPVAPALMWATERGHAAVLPWDGDLGIDPLPLVVEARAYGREIGCYVVNDPERMKQLAACGVWGFVTDVPDVAREALAR